MHQRVKGPNERYAIWDLKDPTFNIDFDRRDRELSAEAIQYIGNINRQLVSYPFAMDFLELLPAEPLIPVLAKIIGKRQNTKIFWQQYSKIRRKLEFSRVMNWKWMDYQKHDGKIRPATPYFLNPLGKFYYGNAFKTSPDTTTKGFYRDKVISNGVFSVKHIDLLNNHYTENGHDVQIGKYPYDLLVDDKHGFILTEMHENSIGVEMRISEAIHQRESSGIQMYLPAMSPEHMRRVSAIVGGVLFYARHIEHFAYATYHEAEISRNRSTNNWSYYLTNSSKNGQASPFNDPLPFPKVDVSSTTLMDTQIRKIKIKESGRAVRRNTHRFETQYINGLNDTEIVPGIRVTVGLGQIGDLWREFADGADVLLTGKIRASILDNIERFPKTLIINEFELNPNELNNDDNPLYDEKDSSKMSPTQIYGVFKDAGCEVLMLPRNHAKAILSRYRLMIHSMTSTNFMGNNRETYAIIDFHTHPERDFIKQTLDNMLHHFAHDQFKLFVAEWNKVRETFGNRIGIFGHFHSRSIRNWLYYKEVLSVGRRYPLKIYTSHIDMKKFADIADEIRIQGTSRFANHKCAMIAKCPVIKERMWHARAIFNQDFVALGSWDVAQIVDQKELQVIIYPDPKEFFSNGKAKNRLWMKEKRAAKTFSKK